MTIGQSRTKYWWSCEKQHSYESTPYSRKQGKGCPYCSRRKLDIKVYNLENTYPELLKYYSHKNQLPANKQPNNIKSIWSCELKHEWESKPTKKMKCPYCSNKRVLIGFNDLKTTHPHLLKDWGKENHLKPTEVIAGSKKKISWSCHKCKHNWVTSLNERAILGNNCPNCAGQVIKAGVNDFFTVNSHLKAEWDYQKNNSEPPVVKKTSSDKAWWLCEEGHSWEASFASRNKGSNCRVCAGKEVIQGVNDLYSRRPKLCRLYSSKNELKPNEIFNHSTKPVLWNCSNCSAEFSKSPHSINNAVLCKDCHKTRSAVEQEVHTFITKITEKQLIKQYKNNNQEIDIFCEELKIGLEVNGDYWHSDSVFLNNFNETAIERHSRKLNYFNNIDIRLAFVWESDWRSNRGAVEAALRLYFDKGVIDPILSKLEGNLK